MRRLTEQMGAYDNAIHLVDGFPMPVCKITCASRSRCFQGEAGYSHCAAKAERYYGFEDHLMIDSQGIISGLLIGYKGYIRPLLTEKLAQQVIELQTPVRKNRKDSPLLSNSFQFDDSLKPSSDN
jgi:hypothetical protein